MAQDISPDSPWQVTKLLLGMVLLLALFVGIPLGLEKIGWGATLRPNSVWVLAATVFGLILSMFLNFGTSGVYQYHRQGFDFCIVTMGAALSSLSIQLVSKDSMLNGMPPGWLTQQLWSVDSASTTSGEISREVTVMYLTTVFVVSLVLALITSKIARIVIHPSYLGKSVVPNCWALLNYVIGVGALIGYLQMLVLGA